MNMSKHEKIKEILSKLPKTTEKRLFMYDQAVNKFIHLLLEGQDVYSVLDEIFLYTNSIIQNYSEEFLHMEKHLTPEDMMRLGRYKFLSERQHQEWIDQENIRKQIAKEERGK